MWDRGPQEPGPPLAETPNHSMSCGTLFPFAPPQPHRFCVAHLFARGKRSFNCSRGFLTNCRFNTLAYVWGPPSLVRLVTWAINQLYVEQETEENKRKKAISKKIAKHADTTTENPEYVYYATNPRTRTGHF